LTLQSEFIRDRGWDFAGEDTQYLTHNFHPFPGKFIPQIPRKLMESLLPEGGSVLDPFCGSGTTLVEANLAGNPCFGVDLNPLFVMIARAKTTRLAGRELLYLERWLDQVSEKGGSLYHSGLGTKRVYPSVDQNLDLAGWFSAIALKEIGLIKSEISQLPSGRLKDFCRTALSSILVRVSYQDSDTRYARVEKKPSPTQTMQIFRDKLKDMIDRMRDFSARASDARVEVVCHDARSLADAPELGNRAFDLVITSPPYVNAYDYHKYHRQRMNWLDVDPTPVRKLEIGGHDRYTRKNADPATYFSDLRKCFTETSKLIKRGGHCCVVIGDGIVGGKSVPTHELIVDTLSSAGLRFDYGIARKVDSSSKYFRNGARIETEYIIVTKKP
jgi:DNA modification methylase